MHLRITGKIVWCFVLLVVYIPSKVTSVSALRIILYMTGVLPCYHFKSSLYIVHNSESMVRPKGLSFISVFQIKKLPELVERSLGFESFDSTS